MSLETKITDLAVAIGNDAKIWKAALAALDAEKADLAGANFTGNVQLPFLRIGNGATFQNNAYGSLTITADPDYANGGSGGAINFNNAVVNFSREISGTSATFSNGVKTENGITVGGADYGDLIGGNYSSVLRLINTVADYHNSRGSSVYFYAGSLAQSSLIGGITSIYSENVGSQYGGNLVFLTKSSNSNILSERMRLTAQGKLLLGTTVDNGYKLQVDGSISIAGVLTLLDGTQKTVTFGAADSGGAGKKVLIIDN